MKNHKLSQLLTLVSKIDSTVIQFASMAFALVVFVVTQTPTDGGVGPR